MFLGGKGVTRQVVRVRFWHVVTWIYVKWTGIDIVLLLGGIHGGTVGTRACAGEERDGFGT